jgi:DNA-binding NarL/FixJ family response regulator
MISDMTDGAALRILIADDQQLVRAGFRTILSTQPDFEVVGEASDGTVAAELADELSPHVVLMDIRMPELNGIEATRRILTRRQQGDIRVLILTTFDLDEYVYEALQAGASGFLLKDASPEQLIAAVRAVRRGDSLLAPSITRRLIEEFASFRLSPNPPAGFDQLSSRELEVFTLVARGLSNREIADKLFVGETTVKTHVTRMLTKLGLRDRVQAVVLAYETGVIKPGSSRQPAG